MGLMAWVAFMRHAHSPRGHGVHSPMLYHLCRQLLCKPFPSSQHPHVSASDTLASALDSWLSDYVSEYLPGRTARPTGKSVDWSEIHQLAHTLQPNELAACLLTAEHMHTDGEHHTHPFPCTVVDLYRWRVLLLHAPMPAQHVRIRPPLRWLMR